MNSLAQKGFTHEEVKKALLSNREYDVRFELLDKDERRIGDVTASGTISSNCEMSIVREASLTIKEIKDINTIDERIKPYYRLRLGGKWLEFPLGVYIISSPTTQFDGYSKSRECQCFDKSVILSEDKIDSRYYIPKTQSYTTAVSQLLNTAGFTYYNIKPVGSMLSSEKEFEIGTKKIDIINDLLKAINYNPIHFDNDGVGNCTPYEDYFGRIALETYATNKDSVIFPNVKRTLDIFNYPNKIVRYVESPDNKGCLKSVYLNVNPASKLSIPSRGRTIADVERVNDIADQTTLNLYTKRVAQEKLIEEIVEFETSIMPHHDYNDCIALDIPENDISGNYIEYAWEIDLTNNKMRHLCKKVVDI